MPSGPKMRAIMIEVASPVKTQITRETRVNEVSLVNLAITNYMTERNHFLNCDNLLFNGTFTK